MSNFKETMNRVQDEALDSMFYRSSDDDCLREVSYKGRRWGIYAFGDVRLTYKGERYYCASDIKDIKSDYDLNEAYNNSDLEIHYNNWYEIRPLDIGYMDYVNGGVYDAVYGNPYELDKDTLDFVLELEKQFDES